MTSFEFLKPHLMRFGKLLLPIVLAVGCGFSAQAETPVCNKVHSPNYRVPENEYYRGLLGDRISPTYQKNWQRFSHFFREDFWRLKNEGAPEIELLEKLGFTVDKDALGVPDFVTMSQNYKKILDELGIPEDQRLLPALTFENLRTKDVMFVVPGRDGWPPGNQGWVIRAEEFRPKGRALLDAIRSGRFPVFSEGVHDVFHFITFALHPSYARALRKGNDNLARLRLKNSDMNRSSYFLEVLTLANPKKKQEIEKRIVIKNPTKKTAFADFHQAMRELSKEDLESRAKFWIENFQKYLNIYAGGIAEPYERSRYRDEIRRNGDWKESLTNPWRGNNRTILPDGLIQESMGLMDVYLGLLLEAKDASMSDGTFQLYLARMEYGLWKSANEIQAEQWAKDTLTDSFDENSPTMQFIKNVFGEKSFTYRLFLRPKQ